MLTSDFENDYVGTMNWAFQQLFGSSGNQTTNYGPPALSDNNDLNPSQWSVSGVFTFWVHPTIPTLTVLHWEGPITITKTIRERKP